MTSFWLALTLLALGYLLRMSHEKPRRFHDVDSLPKERMRAGMRDA